jgi:dolichol-phosphate mannosyltransferase
MIGIIIPCYNEHESIAALVQQISEQLNRPHHIFIIDDSPNELTKQAVVSLQAKNVTLTCRPEKGGRGSAVLEGIRQALQQPCEQIVEMDADFSHPPIELNDMLREAAEQHLDLMIGSRYIEKSKIVNWPLSRRLFSKYANWLARQTLKIPIHDYTNGYRCYSRRAAQQAYNTCGRLGKGFISLSEILVNLYFAGYTVGERPTVFVNRLRGESSLNLGEIIEALIGLFKIYHLKQELLASREQSRQK